MIFCIFIITNNKINKGNMLIFEFIKIYNIFYIKNQLIKLDDPIKRILFFILKIII